MKKFVIAIAMLGLSAGAVTAATVTNRDDKDYTLTVTESGNRTEVGLAAGQTISVCGGGCFLTLPNGDRETLSGSETVEISGGRASIK